MKLGTLPPLVAQMGEHECELAELERGKRLISDWVSAAGVDEAALRQLVHSLPAPRPLPQRKAEGTVSLGEPEDTPLHRNTPMTAEEMEAWLSSKAHHEGFSQRVRPATRCAASLGHCAAVAISARPP